MPQPTNDRPSPRGPCRLFIVSGPSGVGKTTIAKAVLRRCPWLATTVSYTTRTERLGKKEDKTMIHVDEETFRDKVNRGEFLEWAVVHGMLYGTDGPTVRERLKTRHLLLNIDPQGALQIKCKMPERTVLIFLKAESADELVARIQKRQQMNPQELENRLASARRELRLARHYDYVILNQHGRVRETIHRVTTLITRLANTRASRAPAAGKTA
ncbi:MAG: guanylate kinase [Parcubacteria group bacterium Gr01-1014_31]|nr:MAG: guanylate kinase [Parcubacteria group bacterium Gr01-1014_31]